MKNKYHNEEKYKDIKTINFIHSINNDSKIEIDCFDKFDLDFKLKLIDDFEKEYVDTKLISKEHLKSQINSWF